MTWIATAAFISCSSVSWPAFLTGGITWIADKAGVSRYVVLAVMSVLVVAAAVTVAFYEPGEGGWLVPQRRATPAWNEGGMAVLIFAASGYLGWWIVGKVIDVNSTSD